MAALLLAIAGHAARLRAGEAAARDAANGAQGNHCRSDAVAYSYYYADDSPDGSAGDLLDTYQFDDYGSCLNAAQAFAQNVAGRSCFGVSHGMYGVAYSRPVWDVFWNGVYQGTVDDQQYDCGDVSVY